MKQKFQNTWLVAFIFLLSQTFSSLEATQQVRLTRVDGSELLSYVDLPDNDLYPIVFVIDGVPCRSVWPMHASIAHCAKTLGGALITLEKQGITGANTINQKEYDRTYCREARISDYLLYIQEIREGLFAGWNGQIVFVAGSEGGQMIAEVVLQTPETVALAILASGGGIPVREELLWAVRHYLEEQWIPRFAIDSMIDTVDKQFDIAISNPTYKLKLGDYTYKWWASHLQAPKLVDNLLKIDCPIFYAHGTKDQVIPFHSALIAVETLKKAGKTNVVFRPMEGYDHDVRIPPLNIDVEIFDWIKGILKD